MRSLRDFLNILYVLSIAHSTKKYLDVSRITGMNGMKGISGMMGMTGLNCMRF